MTRYAGNVLYATFRGVTITNAPWRSFESGLEEETADASGGVDDIRVMIKTLDMIAPTFEYVSDSGTAGTAIDGALTVGNEGTLIWAPYGTATGMPKWGIVARVTANETAFAFDDAQIRSVSFANVQGTYVHDGRTAVY